MERWTGENGDKEVDHIVRLSASLERLMVISVLWIAVNPSWFDWNSTIVDNNSPDHHLVFKGVKASGVATDSLPRLGELC